MSERRIGVREAVIIAGSAAAGSFAMNIITNEPAAVVAPTVETPTTLGDPATTTINIDESSTTTEVDSEILDREAAIHRLHQFSLNAAVDTVTAMMEPRSHTEVYSPTMIGNKPYTIGPDGELFTEDDGAEGVPELRASYNTTTGVIEIISIIDTPAYGQDIFYGYDIRFGTTPDNPIRELAASGQQLSADNFYDALLSGEIRLEQTQLQSRWGFNEELGQSFGANLQALIDEDGIVTGQFENEGSAIFSADYADLATLETAGQIDSLADAFEAIGQFVPARGY